MSELKWEDLLGLEAGVEEANRKCDVCGRTVPKGEVVELWAVWNGARYVMTGFCATCPKPEVTE